MRYPEEKKLFRLSLPQFETDDGCFSKRKNRVSNLTAQIKLLHDLILEELVSKIF